MILNGVNQILKYCFVLILIFWKILCFYTYIKQIGETVSSLLRVSTILNHISNNWNISSLKEYQEKWFVIIIKSLNIILDPCLNLDQIINQIDQNPEFILFGLKDLFVSMNIPKIYHQNNLILFKELYQNLQNLYLIISNYENIIVNQNLLKNLVCKSMNLLVNLHLSQNIPGQESFYILTDFCFAFGQRFTPGQSSFWVFLYLWFPLPLPTVPSIFKLFLVESCSIENDEKCCLYNRIIKKKKENFSLTTNKHMINFDISTEIEIEIENTAILIPSIVTEIGRDEFKNVSEGLNSVDIVISYVSVDHLFNNTNGVCWLKFWNTNHLIYL